ncbi:condensation domain-containing protein [Catenulispora subtropica]|uniref:Carrier domain-containing protein n=1 Tax=Catenulispora subtropica TaxID=450798 RepID=A0ABN2RN82_9ACTN
MSALDRGPLTDQQRRLWFLDRLDPGDPAHHISTTVLLRGRLDADRLARAFDTVAARHECLHTRFVESAGEPVAEVLPPRPTPVLRADLPDEDAARRAVAELLLAPFDLSAGHLVRIALFRLDAERHVLCIVAHHIIGDGWSLNLLFSQAADVYRGAEPAAPALRYLDYARTHQGTDEAALAYWRAALADAPVLELPLDRERPRRRTSAGLVASRVFDDGVWTSVQEVARELRCTPFMVLMTVYQLTLAQVSGQDEVCVGTPLAGRDEVAAESVFGYFVRMLVLRGDLSGDVVFRELARRTRTACLGAFAHSWTPFEELVADAGARRDPRRNPLFQAAFTLHTTMDTSANGFEGFEGVAVEAFGEGARRTVTDVAMDVFVSSTAIAPRADRDRMEVVLTASADLFDQATADDLADRFAAVLRAVLEDPDVRVGDLPLVSGAERTELLRIGAGPPVATDAGASPLARVELAAALAPGAVAIHSGRERMTRGQLWADSGDLADRLRAAGAGPGNLVGVSLPRGPRQIVALLAIWRCGAGYVPLDPELPDRRLRMLMEQAGVAAVVAADGVGRGADTPTVVADPAFVVFTSGSTGVPKPVLIGRAAVAERVAWMVGAYRLTGDDRVVQFADLGFDAHAEEIWPALAVGAPLVLLPEGPRSLPEVLAADPEITVLDLPTAYWHALLDLEPAWPRALRLVVLGGEQVDAAAIGRWRERHGDRIRLVNTYGPSEATVIATATDLTAADAVSGAGTEDGAGAGAGIGTGTGTGTGAGAGIGTGTGIGTGIGTGAGAGIGSGTGTGSGRRPPIGRPIGGVRAYVLDAAGRLVPRGAAGELCLAGAGLADGYLGRPDLTAERFEADPYGGGLMYRTGDRARWRRDEPVLEFLGRLDRQLKVRGVRIEPGEVEAVVTGHPKVGRAVVTAFGESLVAYVTGTAGADEVRAFCAERLPALLVPDVVVVLDTLPLTARGKVDVRALPVPEADAPRPVFEAPRTEAEELVASIFAELLPVRRVGAHDDFFVLGGHSLLAVRVIARVRAVVGLEVPVRLLFDRPTVAGFAEAVEAALVAEIDQLTEAEAEAQLAARTEAG